MVVPVLSKQKGEPTGSPFKCRDDWTRTSDHTSPRRVLYQLSYIPVFAEAERENSQFLPSLREEYSLHDDGLLVRHLLLNLDDADSFEGTLGGFDVEHGKAGLALLVVF